MENVPIGDARPDNVVPLPGSQTEPAEPFVEGPEATAELSAPAQLATIAEDTLRIAVGFASAVAAALARAFERAVPRPEAASEDDATPAPPSPLAQAAGAMAELTVEVATAAIRGMGSAADAVLPTLSWLTSPAVVRHRVDRVGEAAARLNDRWSDARPGVEELAGAFAAELIPEVAGAVLDRLDLTELVLERVELERVVDALDIDAVVAQVDLEAIVARIDLNEVAKGIDVEAIVERIDLVGLSRYVIDELDLLELVRRSTEGMGEEAAEGIRGRTASADAYVSGIVDRALRRSRTSEREDER